MPLKKETQLYNLLTNTWKINRHSLPPIRWNNCIALYSPNLSYRFETFYNQLMPTTSTDVPSEFVVVPRSGQRNNWVIFQVHHWLLLPMWCYSQRLPMFSNFSPQPVNQGYVNLPLSIAPALVFPDHWHGQILDMPRELRAIKVVFRNPVTIVWALNIEILSSHS